MASLPERIMRIGIFGSEQDPQSTSVKSCIEQLGFKTVIIDSEFLENQTPCSFDGSQFYYNGEALEDVKAWYLRYVMSPYPPAFLEDDDYYLYRDWLIEYLRKREKSGFILSWLIHLSRYDGIPLVNTPAFGSIAQLKALQLASANKIGLNTPKTLITNNPDEIRQFMSQTPNLVYKPSMGGGLCHQMTTIDLKYLSQIRKSPVTFQENIVGTSLRLTFVGDELVSSVKIPSNYLDFRSDPDYIEGKTQYQECHVPEEIVQKLRLLMKDQDLIFTGIDLIKTESGKFYFIEANSSPVFYDIELKTQTPISQKLAELLIKKALQHDSKSSNHRTKPTTNDIERSFVSYGNPFDPDRSWGGRYDRSK